jgi:hypothetical protein
MLLVLRMSCEESKGILLLLGSEPLNVFHPFLFLKRK